MIVPAGSRRRLSSAALVDKSAPISRAIAGNATIHKPNPHTIRRNRIIQILASLKPRPAIDATPQVKPDLIVS
jgi:hypothetical protein